VNLKKGVFKILESLKQVKYAKKKGEDPLPQSNLALIFGEDNVNALYHRHTNVFNNQKSLDE